MFIKNNYNFNDLLNKCWAGALDTLKVISDNNKEDEFMNFLKAIYFEEVPTITQVNDLLWFEEVFIYESIGIERNEEDE